MNVKLFEVRDRATCIPVMAVHLRNRTPEEFFLLRRAGYSAEQIGGREEDVEPYVVMWRLEGGPAEYDPHRWGSRTMKIAHMHAIKEWHGLTSGDVLDVEFILGETNQPKTSESLMERR